MRGRVAQAYLANPPCVPQAFACGTQGGFLYVTLYTRRPNNRYLFLWSRLLVGDFLIVLICNVAIKSVYSVHMIKTQFCSSNGA